MFNKFIQQIQICYFIYIASIMISISIQVSLNVYFIILINNYIMIGIFLLLLVLLIGSINGEPLQLFYVTTNDQSHSSARVGSIKGGTMIYINGLGFNPVAHKNFVFVGYLPCKIPAEGVTSTFISCETTASGFEMGGQKITVIANAQIKTLSRYTFSYRCGHTPQISDVFPSSQISHKVINIWGRHRVNSVGDGERDFGDILSVHVGDEQCGLFDITQGSVTYNGVDRLKCRQARVQEGGKYNISEHMKVGKSTTSTFMRKSSLQDEYYEHVVLPSISQVSPPTGILGGQILTIDGSGFSNHPSSVTVSVDGVDCHVLSSTTAQITCDLEEKTSSHSGLLDTDVNGTQQDGYLKGGGFHYQRYAVGGINFAGFKAALDSGSHSMQLLEERMRAELQSVEIFGSYYGEVWKGYFYAPTSGNYTFRGSADDSFGLYISDQYGTKSLNPTPLIYSYSSTVHKDNYYIDNQASAINGQVQLQEGKYYYMEVYHVNQAGAGYMKVSVEVPNDNEDLYWHRHQVVKFSTSFVNDPQVMEFSLEGATGGTFTLYIYKFNSQTLDVLYDHEVQLNWNASATEFQNAIRQFYLYQNYHLTTTVQGYDQYNMQTTLDVAYKVVWRVKIYHLRSQSHQSEQFEYRFTNTLGSPFWKEERVHEHCPLIGGTFNMVIGERPVAVWDSASRTYSNVNISPHVGASTLQAALRSLPGMGSTEVSRTGDSSYGAQWLINFKGYQKDVQKITFYTDQLTGGKQETSPTISHWVVRQHSNNLLVNPVNQFFMFAAAASSHVLVQVNQVNAVCWGDCEYLIEEDSPELVLQSISNLSSSTITLGITDPLLANYNTDLFTVSIAGVPCQIISGTFDNFDCQLSASAETLLPVGEHYALVTIDGVGRVLPSDSVDSLLVPLVLSTVQPSSTYTNGGLTILLSGTGFPHQSPILELCSVEVQIISYSPTQIQFIAPQCNEGSYQLTLSHSQSSQSIAFTYTIPPNMPYIYNMSTHSHSPVLKGAMQIEGDGFTSGSSVSVHLVNGSGPVYPLKVISYNDTYIKCGISGGLPGQFNVSVMVEGVGYAVPTPIQANDFVYELVITDISPREVNYYGGTLITIDGRNFSPDLLQNLVFVGNQLNWFCDVQLLTTTQIQCRVPPYNMYWKNGTQIVVITNRLIMDNTCEGNCYIQYKNKTSTPIIKSITPKRIVSGNLLTITGELFDIAGDVSVVFENKLTEEKTVASSTTYSGDQVKVEVPDIEGGSYEVRVRLGEEAESNSAALDVNTQITTTYKELSVMGGIVEVSGFGFPRQHPRDLFDIALQSGGVKLDPSIIDISPTSLKISLPAGNIDQQYKLVIKNPINTYSTAMLKHTQAATPSLTLLQPTSNIPPGIVNIILQPQTHIGQLPSSVSVYHTLDDSFLQPITNYQLNPNNQLVFQVDFKGGNYGIHIYYALYGYAEVNATVSVELSSPVSVSSTTVGYRGGVITVGGSDIGEGSRIQVGALQGSVQAVSDTQTIFNVPPLLTPSVLSQYPTLAHNKKISGTFIADVSQNAGVAFDGTHGTHYQSSNRQCFVGIDVGQGLLMNLMRVKYFPFNRWRIASNYLKGATIQGSIDGSTYTTLHTLDQSAHSGWNSFLIHTSTNYRYVRFKHTTLSKCMLAELEFYGMVYSDIATSHVPSYVVPTIHFNDGITTQSFTNILTYAVTSTPVIDAITPANGDVFGGYNITLSGEYLDIGQPTIIIDGIQCVVRSQTSTEIKCEVGERLDLPQEKSFTVSVGGNIALIREKFEYVLRWSDVRTWGADLPPVEGDLVYVPNGMTLLIDETTPILEGIIVQKGAILFADESDMEIHTGFITLNGGQFRAGTQTHPYQHQLTFIMYGDYYGQQQPMFGNKGIGCYKCTFSMHGQVRQKTWTTLASTIQAGQTSFEVLDDVDWTVGEEIVVASTSFRYEEAEQRTIVSVSGKVITVDTAFKHLHFGGTETFGSDVVHIRAEVALLSRNIKMMGDPGSQEKQYGSHLIMTGSQEEGMVSHVAYTQFTKCGQPKIEGRYCMHFHMNGDVPQSYVKGNAVHHSFARILTLHGIQYLRVNWNVGYWVKGHNFFIEDGIEMQNILEYNLAIASLESWQMMQTDISVASYWVTNPLNHLRFNHAAGGDFYGFWYEVKNRPDGPSATSDVCPRGNPLGESHDNVAHSYERFGLRILQLVSREKPCRSISASNPSVQSRFYNYFLYKNGRSGLLAEKTGNIVYQNFTIAQNGNVGLQFIVVKASQVIALNSKVIGTFSTPEASSKGNSNFVGVYAPKSNGWRMSGIEFYNFPSNMVALQTCHSCNSPSSFVNTGKIYHVNNITYHNMSGKYLVMNGLKRDIIYDEDGTFSSDFNQDNRSYGQIIHGFSHLIDEPGCDIPTDTNAWGYRLLCNETVPLRRVMFYNMKDPYLFDSKAMKIQVLGDINETVPEDTTDYLAFRSVMSGKEPKSDRPKTFTMWYVSGQIYNAWWHTGSDFTHATIKPLHLTPNDDAIIFKHNYTLYRELYRVKRGSIYPNATSYDHEIDTCELGEYIHDSPNRTISVCVSGKGQQSSSPVTIRGYPCLYMCPKSDPNVEKQDFVRLWSNATQWPNGQLPQEGDNVTVHGNWTLLMDINPPPLQFLYIDGDLFIPETNTDASIIAEAIWVRAGKLIAGVDESQPFEGNLTIQIRGQKRDSGIVIDTATQGSKFFVVTGTLKLYGIAPETTITKLLATVHVGDTSMIVGDATGWQIGDEIVISPSYSSPSQHEKVTIGNIIIDDGVTTVQFDPPLIYNHYGNEQETINNEVGILDARTSIGHVSRNIKIISGEDNGWGYSLVGYGFKDSSTLRVGTVNMFGVEMLDGGQYDTENSAIKLKNLIRGGSSIKKCSISNCKSYCLDIENSHSLTITDNVFYHGRVFHVRALSMTNFIFSRNLMISVVKRPTVSVDELVACYGSYEEVSLSAGIKVHDNVCQGAVHGFALAMFPCHQLDNDVYVNNTVGSATVGWILNKASSSCVGFSSIKAYGCHIAHIASPAPVDSIVYEKFLVADSGRGVSLRFGKEGSDRTAYLRDSFITAISRPDCSECYTHGALDCSGNLGVRMLVVTVNGESLPSKSGPGFDVICKHESFDSKVFIDNVVFQNFNLNYDPTLPRCSNNRVFRSHPLATDITGSHHLSGTTCDNCSIEAYAYFDAPSSSQLGWDGGCGKILCTGKINYLIHDHTGDFLLAPGILMARNQPIGDNSQDCYYIRAMNGYYCMRTDFGVLEYESIAPDFNKRIMWPVYMRYDGGSWTSITNAFIQWEWEGNEPLNKRMARFITIVQLQQMYNMTFESMPPIDMRFQFQRRTVGGDNSEYIIVKLHYPKPNSIRVRARGKTVRPISLLDNNGEQPLNVSQCGSNKYFYKNYTIHFVITGAKDCQVRVSLTNSLQLTARFVMPIDQFFEIDGKTKFIDRMCALLQIYDTSRLKIVGVFSGSVQIVMVIDEEALTDVDNAFQNDNEAQKINLESLLDNITDYWSSGVLAEEMQQAGLYGLESLNSILYNHEDDEEYFSVDDNIPNPEQFQEQEQWNALVLVICVASISLVLVNIIGIVYLVRKRMQVGQLIAEETSKRSLFKYENRTEEDIY